jgi:hypothetical protein
MHIARQKITLRPLLMADADTALYTWARRLKGDIITPLSQPAQVANLLDFRALVLTRHVLLRMRCQRRMTPQQAA